MANKINLTSEKELEFITASSFDDDSYDFEVWYKDDCLFVYHIKEDYSISVYFGKTKNEYVINNTLLNKISNIAEEKLKGELKKWLDNVDNLPN